MKSLLYRVKAVLVVSDDIIAIGNWFYVKVTATFQDVESQEQVKAFGYAREPDVTNTGQERAPKKQQKAEPG